MVKNVFLSLRQLYRKRFLEKEVARIDRRWSSTLPLPLPLVSHVSPWMCATFRAS